MSLKRTSQRGLLRDLDFSSGFLWAAEIQFVPDVSKCSAVVNKFN